MLTPTRRKKHLTSSSRLLPASGGGRSQLTSAIRKGYLVPQSPPTFAAAADDEAGRIPPDGAKQEPETRGDEDENEQESVGGRAAMMEMIDSVEMESEFDAGTLRDKLAVSYIVFGSAF